MTDSYSVYPNLGGVPRYNTAASLPATAPAGDLAVVVDSDTLYIWNGTVWLILAVGGETVFSVSDTTTIDLTKLNGDLSADVVLESLTDAHISPTAAIALSKLATGALPSAITVDTSNIVSETIVDGDISPTAAISLSKLATGALPSAITVDSSNIVNETIVNADISTTAAIAGSKIVPEFTQNVIVPHNSGIETNTLSATLNIGTTTSTSTLNIGSGTHANEINIGTGPGQTSINLGGPLDTVSIAGTLAVINTTNLDVADKTITVNKGGLVNSGFSTGIQVEEDGISTGYVQTSGDRSAWNLQAPAAGGPVSIKTPAVSATLTLDGSAITESRTLTVPNVNGTIITTGDTGSITSAMIENGTIVDGDISASAGISLTKLATGALPSAITVDSSNIVNESITNEDISPTAAIEGSKIAEATTLVPGVVTTGTQTLGGLKTFDAGIVLNSAPLTPPLSGQVSLGATSNRLIFGGFSGFQAAFSTTLLSSSRLFTLPNVNGTLITTGDTGTVTNTMLAGSIARSKLASGTADHVLINDGSGVVSSEAQLAVTRGGTGLASLTTGDILYTSGTNTLSTLPIGTAGQVLTVVGGVPVWQAAATDPLTTAGDIFHRNSSNVSARLPVGAANTVLTSNGTVPVYSQIVNANVASGAAIEGSKLQAATSTNAGVVTTGVQAFRGDKTIITSAGTALTLVNQSSDPSVLRFESRNSEAAIVSSALIGSFDENGIGVLETSNNLHLKSGNTTSNKLVFESSDGVGGAFTSASIYKTSAPNSQNTGLVLNGGTGIGAKVHVATTTASTSPDTGALTVAGGLGVGGALHVQGGIVNRDGGLELGGGRTVAGSALVDFTTNTGSPDYNARTIRGAGPNGSWDFIQTGSGAINILRGGTAHIIADGNGTAVQGRTLQVGAGYVGQEIFAGYPFSSDVGPTFGDYTTGGAIFDIPITPGIWIINWRLAVVRRGAGTLIGGLASGVALNGAVTSQGTIASNDYAPTRVGATLIAGCVQADSAGSVIITCITGGNIKLRGYIAGDATILGGTGMFGTYMVARRIA